MISVKSKALKQWVILLFLTQAFIHGRAADTLKVCSPSGKICVKVWMDRQLSYAVQYNGKSIVAPSAIDLLLQNKPSLSSSKAI